MHCDISSDEHDSPNNKKEDLRKCYPDRFEGIGNFDGEFHITTDRNVTPVVHAPQKCSIHMYDKIKSELEQAVPQRTIESLNTLIAYAKYARSNAIDMVIHSPHCMHKMQPLDRTFFKSLKSAYAVNSDTWMVSNPGK